MQDAAKHETARHDNMGRAETGMIMLPITLTAAGAAALINFWLSLRIGKVRYQAKVSIGDGGDMNLIANMRAQANFVEYTPFVLILIGVIELAVGSPTWLWIVSTIYLLGRIAHALGMGGQWPRGRSIGTLSTILVMLGLAGYALVLPYMHASATPTLMGVA